MSLQPRLDAFLSGINKTMAFLNTVQEMNTIILPSSVFLMQKNDKGYEFKRTPFLHRGDKIKLLFKAAVWNCEKEEDVSHEVVKLFGAGTHSFSIVVKDLLTNKEEKIDLPNF